MNLLNPTEQQFAKNIINTGLNSGAKQLSFFMREQLAVTEVDFDKKNQNTDAALLSVPDETPLYMLSTSIVGELGGICFLIFTPQDADELRSKALADIPKNSAMYEELKDAILLEVDNIITAAVITQFANLLRCNIHGSVPSLKIQTKEAATKTLAEEAAKNAHVIDFKAQFSTTEKSFTPFFIWYLDDSFVQTIQQKALASI